MLLHSLNFRRIAYIIAFVFTTLYLIQKYTILFFSREQEHGVKFYVFSTEYQAYIVQKMLNVDWE